MKAAQKQTRNIRNTLNHVTVRKRVPLDHGTSLNEHHPYDRLNPLSGPCKKSVNCEYSLFINLLSDRDRKDRPKPNKYIASKKVLPLPLRPRKTLIVEQFSKLTQLKLRKINDILDNNIRFGQSLRSHGHNNI